MEINKLKTIITLFIQALYGKIEADAFLNICLKDSKHNGIITKSFPFHNFDQISDTVIKNREKTDVYFEVCLQAEPPAPGKRGNTEGVKIVPGFWIDIDIAGRHHKSAKYPKSHDEALKFLYSLPWRASIVVCSGGGIHAYYIFATPFLINNSNDRQLISNLSRQFQNFIITKGLQHGWKIDNTSDLARLLRVPGTLNHKSEIPRDVSIIESCTTVLDSVEDFQIVLDREEILDGIVEPATQNVVPVKNHINITGANYAYPEADINFIEQHCRWMAHCHNDAVSLSEPEWFAACSIWSRCKDGRIVAHERSKPYPGYDPAEADKKVDNALKAAPRTCPSILTGLGASQYCDECFMKDKGRSPISLGNTDPIIQARLKIANVVFGIEHDPNRAFEDDNLAALALLKIKSPGYYVTAVKELKKAGIAKGEIRPALDRFIATHDMKFDDVASYEVVSSCIYMNKATAQGMVLVKLSLFSANISEEIIKNDGSTSERFYQIEGFLQSGEPLPTVTLLVQEFESMTWIGRLWGAKAWYAAGATTRDNLRAAITFLSQNPPCRYIFTHTGWAKLAGEWVFLTEAGAIGVQGLIDTFAVDLSGSNLGDFSLPKPDEGFSFRETIKKCLLLLELLPKRISYPLLSAVFRAPLGEPLPITFALFIVGATGTRKTEAAAIAQSFFGQSFNGKNLPCNWSSTANAIEKLTFLTKDVLVVIDDYLPGDNPRQMNSKADRIFRALGNRAGRQRMTADTNFHKEYYPRALIVSTAEDVPSGQSLTGRMLVLEIAEGDVELNVLTELQKLSSQGVFNGVMYEYLKWLVPQIDALKKELPSYKAELRDKAVSAEKTHTRTPDILADLTIGFQGFCTFAVAHGAMTDEEAVILQDECWTSILNAAGKQQSQQKVGDPCERYRDFLLTSFLMGKAHLADKTGGAPTDSPETWGWKKSSGLKDDSGLPISTLFPQGSLIGWVDDKYVYLNAEAAYKTAQDIGGRDRQITTSQKTLLLRLAERKHLVPDPTTGGNTVRMTGVKGTRSRVMQIHKSFFYEKDEDAATTKSIGFFSPQPDLQGSQAAPLNVLHLEDALQETSSEVNPFEVYTNAFGKN